VATAFAAPTVSRGIQRRTRLTDHYPDGMNSVGIREGQVTITQGSPHRLGIRAGQVLDFEEEDRRLVAKKVSPVDPVASVWGILRSGSSSDEMIRELRGDVDPS